MSDLRDGTGEDLAAVTPRHATVALAEAGLHAEWRREPVPGRPVLVFLHDGLGCTRSLRDLPERIADRLAVGAVAYDRWGYGRSPSRDAFPPFFMEEEAQRLPRILEALAIDDYCLVAHSDGGTIALLHAATAPPGLRAVVSMSAHVTFDRLTREGMQRHQRDLDEGRVPEFMRRFHGERGAHVMWCWTSLVRDPVYRDWDIRARLGTIRCPLLAIQGAEDAYGLPRQLVDIANAVPHARTRLLEGIGHFPHVEDPAGTARLVAGFLAPYCGGGAGGE